MTRAQLEKRLAALEQRRAPAFEVRVSHSTDSEGEREAARSWAAMDRANRHLIEIVWK